MDTDIALSGIVTLMYCQVSHCMVKSVEVFTMYSINDDNTL